MLAEIREYFSPYLARDEEGCAFLMYDGQKYYLLPTNNQAVSSGLSISTRALFATDPTPAWKAVRDYGHTIVAMLHNHPYECGTTPSQTDLVGGLPMTWYSTNSGEKRNILWYITNGEEESIWRINSNFLRQTDILTTIPFDIEQITCEPVSPESLDWMK